MALVNSKDKKIFATLPRPQRGQPLVLGGDPLGKKFLYTNRHSVIIRDIEDPAVARIYTEHTIEVMVAKYAPNGVYIASGDRAGKVRVWNAINKEHTLKNAFQPLMGSVKDIAWSPDSKHIVVVGEGGERFGHVFIVETGTSVGTISGPTKTINSCDFAPSGPMRIITGSDDSSVAIFDGPPFKLKQTIRDHKRAVLVVRFSPNGELFASAGSDGRVLLYDANRLELLHELGQMATAHLSSVTGLAWNPSSTELLTCSTDGKCHLWFFEENELLGTFHMGNELVDQPVGCLWQGSYILVVLLSGNIHYLNEYNTEMRQHVIRGHNKPITVLGHNEQANIIYTGSYDGLVVAWDAVDGCSDNIAGKGHENLLNGLCGRGNYIYTCGFDDCVRKIDIKAKSYTDWSAKMAHQPRGLCILQYGCVIVVACVSELVVIENDRCVFTLPLDYEPHDITGNERTREVAVGGSDNRLHIYKLKDECIEPILNLEHLGEVTSCEFSPDCNYLVAGDTYRRVMLYTVPDYYLAHDREWSFHNARINTVSWSPDSQFIASGSLDTTIIIWSVNEPSRFSVIRQAHPKSQVNCLLWLNNTTLISTGQDGNTRIMDIEFL